MPMREDDRLRWILLAESLGGFGHDVRGTKRHPRIDQHPWISFAGLADEKRVNDRAADAVHVGRKEADLPPRARPAGGEGLGYHDGETKSGRADRGTSENPQRL